MGGKGEEQYNVVEGTKEFELCSTQCTSYTVYTKVAEKGLLCVHSSLLSSHLSLLFHCAHFQTYISIWGNFFQFPKSQASFCKACVKLIPLLLLSSLNWCFGQQLKNMRMTGEDKFGYDSYFCNVIIVWLWSLLVMSLQCMHFCNCQPPSQPRV